MSDAAPQLKEAHELIENGDREAALTLLNEIQADFENDPDYWWIYSHATDDPQAGQQALERVTALKADYPGVSALLQSTSKAQATPPSRIQSLPSTQPSATSGIDDFELDSEFDLDDEFDFSETGAAQTGGNRGRSLLVAVVIIAILVIGAAFILNNLNGASTADPTTIADNPTEESNISPIIDETEAPDDNATSSVIAAEDTPTRETATEEAESATEEAESATEEAESATEEAETATEEPTVIVTDVPATETPFATAEAAAVDPIAELIGQLDTFNLPEDAVSIRSSSLGETLVVGLCATPGPGATTLVGEIATVVAGQIDQFDTSITAVGFSITNCDENTISRTVAVPRAILEAYGDGSVSFTDFQTLLRPIN